MILQNTARTSANLWLRTIVVIAGFLVGIIGYFYENNGLLPLLPTFVLVFGWFLYVFWYSRFDNRTHTFEIGKTLPDFELETTDKKKIVSKSFIGKPAVFMFYRGNWCPLCMAQIKELAARYKELEKRGVAVVLVSPQPHQFSTSLAEKYQVNFQFLVDANNKVAKQLGIFHKNGLPAGMQLMGYQNDTVMPTLIVTDANGTIIFADLTDNYRIRPEPDIFLAILDESLNNS